MLQANTHLASLLTRLKSKSSSASNTGNWEGDVAFAKQVETIADQVNGSLLIGLTFIQVFGRPQTRL